MAAYLIVQIEVQDPVAYARYREQVPPLIAKHHGEFLVRGGAVTTLEGTWHPERLVLIKFPDRAAAQAFWDDPDYKPVADLRYRAAKSEMILVDGA